MGGKPCDTCGAEQGDPVIGWTFVYIGNDESYAFCSDECHEKHWISSDVSAGQQRLHELDTNTSKSPESEGCK